MKIAVDAEAATSISDLRKILRLLQKYKAIEIIIISTEKTPFTHSAWKELKHILRLEYLINISKKSIRFTNGQFHYKFLSDIEIYITTNTFQYTNAERECLRCCSLLLAPPSVHDDLKNPTYLG